MNADPYDDDGEPWDADADYPEESDEGDDDEDD